MTSRLPIPLILGLVLLAACGDDPAQPTPYCDDVAAGCGVDGIDLAIVEAEIDFADDQPFETEVDAHVVAPGDTIALRVHVVNRGTEAAAGALLRINGADVHRLASEPIPPLEPGEERVIGVDVVMPQLRMWPDMEYSLSAYFATESTDWLDDAEGANNYMYEGLTFHPLVPILEVELDLPDTIRSLHPHVFSGTVHNRSPFVASTDIPFGICIYPGNVVCQDQPDGPLTATGIVSAADSRVVPVGITAPMEWGVDLNHREQPVSIGACFPDEEGWSAGITCAPAWYDVVLVPNLEAMCTPPVLVAPSVFESADPAAACDLWQNGSESNFYIWALDADEGDRFRFSAAESGAAGYHLEVYDVEGVEIALGTVDWTFTAPRSARYYVVSAGPFGPPSAPIGIERED